MSRNFLLLATTTILSMVPPSHSAISFLQIFTLELNRPYCNVTDNSAVFTHDLTPLQSSAPIELPSDTLYCKASTISDDTRNMSYVRSGAAESSLDIAHVTCPAQNEVLIPHLNTFLWLIVMLIPLFGLFAFLWKNFCAEHERQEWRRWMRDTIEFRRRTYPKVRASIAIFDKIARIDKEKGPYIKQTAMRYIEESDCMLCKSNSTHKIPSICYLLNEAFDELETLQEIRKVPKLYDFATLFLMLQANRILFMNVPTDKKASWLKGQYYI
ncbi:hypothetical protein KSP39_PZI016468 [Platanthera zijinensis]|uniref:Uncharacterized protein n=1 Tax=Platanthera zijinensis TaxID=2320716 RepID=A0AAP0G0M3_9ASPA